MKNSLQISATIDQPGLLEHLVEKLVYNRIPSENNIQKISDDEEVLETSSAEAWVNGSMEIDTLLEHINMPFNTRFVFTCIKIKDRVYKLEWGCSLS
jgi:hypothetical protein